VESSFVEHRSHDIYSVRYTGKQSVFSACQWCRLDVGNLWLDVVLDSTVLPF
jgi:hypothetical protein